MTRLYCQGTVQEASFDFSSFKLHRLDEGPATSTTLTRDEALRLYKEMVTIRRLETASANLYKEKAIRGFCHLCSGQEAVYSGIVSALRPQDTVITSYRAHGFTYALGVPILGVLAELTGKKSGCVRGKGGSMHMYTKNFYGGNAVWQIRVRGARLSPPADFFFVGGPQLVRETVKTWIKVGYPASKQR